MPLDVIIWLLYNILYTSIQEASINMDLFETPQSIQAKTGAALMVRIFKFLGWFLFIVWVTAWLFPFIHDTIRLIKA